MSISTDELVGFSNDEEDEVKAQVESPGIANRDLDLLTSILERRSVCIFTYT